MKFYLPGLFNCPVTATFSFDLILVEGGSFLMGDGESDVFVNEQAIHPVRLTDFYIGKFPVTQALWKTVMDGENPSFFKGDKRPVETVRWDDAQIFLKRLNSMEAVNKHLQASGLSGATFDLPTEAQWEYAARGGNLSRGFMYAGSNKLNEVGWCKDNSYGETKPVGLKFSNELGIYDMSGNVWEWCHDWYSKDYYKECLAQGEVENPIGSDKGADRVHRGGGYFSGPRYCRCSYRSNLHPEFRVNDLGFRLALSPQSDGKSGEEEEKKRPEGKR